MKLSDRETATVLAALRHWQQDMQDMQDERIAAALHLHGHFAEHVPLSNHEIDLLCEKINLGEPEG